MFNLVLLLLVIILGHSIIEFLNLPDDFPTIVLYFIPAAAFLVNAFQGFNSWLIRKKKFKRVSANKLVRRSSEGVAQVSLGLAGFSNALIISDILGQIANIIFAIWQSLKNGLKISLISIKELKYVLKQYSEFPKYNLLPAFMSACSFYLPPIFINKFYSAEFAGYYDLTKLILSVPIAFVATSVSSVILQKSSEKFLAGESIMKDIKPMIYLVLLITGAEIAAILIGGNYIFMIFGNEWDLSGRLSFIMVWSFALNFIISSFSSLFIAMQKIKIYSIWQIIYFFSIITLLLFRDLEFLSFLKIYVAIESVCFILLIALLVKIVASYEKKVVFNSVR